MKHYSMEELGSYCRGNMIWFQRLHCRHHLNNCRVCRTLLREYIRNEKLAAKLRDVRKYLLPLRGEERASVSSW